jgi:hypothetical protein
MAVGAARRKPGPAVYHDTIGEAEGATFCLAIAAAGSRVTMVASKAGLRMGQ